MRDYVVEIIGEHGECIKQLETKLAFDPTHGSTETRDFIRDLIWNEGGCFHPIVGEDAYPEGWYRFEINISPPAEEEA